MAGTPLPALVYRAARIARGTTATDFALLPAHRKVRWEHVAEQWLSALRDGHRETALYRAVHFDCFVPAFDALDDQERVRWAASSLALVRAAQMDSATTTVEMAA